MIILHVKYNCKPDCREAFLNAIKENRLDEASRNESGNLKYDYSFDAEDKNALILTELWKDKDAVAFHNGTEHFKKLGEMKAEYVESVEIQRFEAEPIL